MSNKQKKKRSKVYRGTDAAITRPTVTRITAANRSKLGQWFFERKKIIKPVGIAAAVVGGLTVLIVEFVRIANGL